MKRSTEKSNFDSGTLVVVSKRTQNAASKNPKWNESFVFQLGQMHDFDSGPNIESFLLEISVWSSNFVMSDNCIGRAFLKFDNSQETGNITNWLKLKND